MGFSSTSCYRNKVGKILCKLRVDYGETQAKQAERLGYTQCYLSMVSTDKRKFSYDLYCKIMERYGTMAVVYKTELIKELLQKDVEERFLELFPESNPEKLLYILYGETK